MKTAMMVVRQLVQGTLDAAEVVVEEVVVVVGVEEAVAGTGQPVVASW